MKGYLEEYGWPQNSYTTKSHPIIDDDLMKVTLYKPYTVSYYNGTVIYCCLRYWELVFMYLQKGWG